MLITSLQIELNWMKKKNGTWKNWCFLITIEFVSNSVEFNRNWKKERKTMQTRILTAQTMLLIVLSGAHLVSGSEADSQADECRIIVANNVNKSNPVIIRGISRRLTDESRYCSYLAIPYAWPPINAYRFQPPMLYPLEQIDTNRTFTHEPNWCLQAIILYANRLLVGTEDCLYLNVFMSGRISQKLSVNASDEAIRLHPVVVWIHGGSFNYGTLNLIKTFITPLFLTHALAYSYSN